LRVGGEIPSFIQIQVSRPELRLEPGVYRIFGIWSQETGPTESGGFRR